ncbi:DUF1127 domain-containing protein [Roseibium algae]|uniref:DUF1127 domain-containing protein n=1 Tax=Roseibium algae TaxID=3123038 RepID=UPI003BF5DC3C
MSVVDAIVRERSRRNAVVSTIVGFAVRKLVLWLHLSRSRRHLSKLSDEALSDIGLTRERAFGEAIRPFWDTSNPPRSKRG